MFNEILEQQQQPQQQTKSSSTFSIIQFEFFARRHLVTVLLRQRVLAPATVDLSSRVDTHTCLAPEPLLQAEHQLAHQTKIVI
ncbi:hypothetical protein BpHYR1_009845 [Brachionus plicatilis]|uniref:Uncharacterized protein n=1 Tax=Brachionus plicatilis TaxID=10195 RepID=A0A3M7SVD0_BRAPC|nr:hypothetical protein BpHYR1_009845 [Brachionus plicatilis]